jgi:ABC-2 type transport system ATP-binding protein
MDLIRTDGLVKTYPGFSLGPVDLRIAAGEILGIVGPNGAGKTTLLKLIWGFLRPDRGSISVFRQQPHLNQLSVRLRAGYLSETPTFYDWMTARRHLTFVSEFYECWDAAYADTLLDRFGIHPDSVVGALSPNSRIKLALIAAVGHHPSLLLLDHPIAECGDVLDHNVAVVWTSCKEVTPTPAHAMLMLDGGRVTEYVR